MDYRIRHRKYKQAIFLAPPLLRHESVLSIETSSKTLSFPNPQKRVHACIQSSHSSKHDLKLYIRSLSSALAESVTALALYPLDSIVLQRQLSVEQRLPFRGLYNGLISAVVSAAPTAAVFSTVYYSCRDSIRNRVPEQFHFVSSVAAGALANAISNCIDTPFTLVRNLIQAGIYPSTQKALSGVLKQNGILGLFTGFRCNLLSSLPFDALEFAGYDHLKKVWMNVKQKKSPLQNLQLTDLELLAIGMLTGAIAGAVTCPLDVLRAKMVTNSVKYSGIRQSVKILLEEEGFMVFSRGLKEKAFKEAVNSGVFFSTFEMFGKLTTDVLTPSQAKAI